MIRKMTLDDDLEQVADIIYQTDEELFQFLFGKPDCAKKRLTTLLFQENNSFSYQRIHLEINDDIRGILLEHDTLDRNRDFASFLRAFGVIGLIGLILRTLLLFPMITRKVKKERYIQCLSVKAQYRGLGIGSELLKNAFSRAEKAGIKEMTLDVETVNQGAKKLYERHGFIIKQTRHSWLLSKKVYRMVKSIM